MIAVHVCGGDIHASVLPACVLVEHVVRGNEMRRNCIYCITLHELKLNKQQMNESRGQDRRRVTPCV